jgi:bifunctional non-homologous end joining protein LigD
MGKLRPYRAKRDFKATAEPAGAEKPEEAAEEPAAKPAKEGTKVRKPMFVVQEHHARRLHWDFRLERDGVLVSWAVPRGIPEDPRRNNLAVHVEDHPFEYGSFEGQIPKGSYGAGQVKIWDQGTYDTEKWQMDAPKKEVMVTLHGKRLRGRYVLFQTKDENWMIHRMDPPQDPDREPMPERVVPMLARLADSVPRPDDDWAFEFKWDGIRAVAFCEGGSFRLMTRKQEDVTRRYPELRALATELGSRAAVLDGEIVALGRGGVPSFEQLQQRMGLTAEAEVRRKMKEVPVIYMIFDVVYLEGHRLFDTPYLERRARLTELELAGPSWQTPEHQLGEGAAMLEASRAAGLEGVMAKRADSRYEEGRRTGAWLKIKNHLSQELVIAGWAEGEGKRRGLPGALLVGYYDEEGRFVYAGKVGTGFTEQMLERLARLMAPLARDSSPFDVGQPPRGAHFVEPKLVGEFRFAEWTKAGQLRAPAFKGLRDDKDAGEVVRERPVE